MEGASVINECKHQKLHLELASGIFEQINNDGEVVVTSFNTHGTPLIGYRISDSMAFADKTEKCSCGMESPLVKKIDGRGSDFIYTAGGAKIKGGNIASVFKNIPNAIFGLKLYRIK